MNRALILFALLASAPAMAQTPDDNAAIAAAAQAFDDAQRNGDREALERMLAPDFLFVRGSGRVGDRREFIAGFSDAAARIEPFAISDRLFLRVGPDVAIVGGEARMKGVENGKPLARRYRYSQTLARRDGRWLLVYVQITGLPDR